MRGQHRIDFEIAHPPISPGLITDRHGEVIGAVKFAQALVQTEELLRELALIQSGGLREVVNATPIVDRFRSCIVGDKSQVRSVLPPDSCLEGLIGGRTFHIYRVEAAKARIRTGLL